MFTDVLQLATVFGLVRLTDLPPCYDSKQLVQTLFTRPLVVSVAYFSSLFKWWYDLWRSPLDITLHKCIFALNIDLIWHRTLHP